MPRETKVGSGGFVRYVDHMGTDESIVASARISTGRGFVSWEPYKRCKKCKINTAHDYVTDACEHDWENFPKGDQGIINYMMSKFHTSPFEFGEIIFHLRVPMDIWRQIIRHRTANVQEYSTRYSEAIDEMATTRPEEWRKQAQVNRQGSAGFFEKGTYETKEGWYLTARENELHELARAVYEERLELGVAKEQARKDLPLSNYTEAYWKLDTHNLFHFLSLRLDAHAQIETRQFGQGINSIVKELFPHCYSAFEEYKLYAVTFSRTEITILRQLCGQLGMGLVHPLFEDREATDMKFSKRELKEFLDKIGVVL